MDPRLSLRLLPLLALLVACGTKYTCPENFVLQGNSCYCPEGQGFHQDGVQCLKDLPAEDTTDGTSDTVSDIQTVDQQTGGDATDLPDTGATDDAVDNDVAPDVPTVDVQPDVQKKKVVGASCTDDIDCLGGLECFAWPAGYCTMTSCTDTGTPCPGASQCWQPDSTLPKICAQSCEGDSDCRGADGYACKRLTTDFGGVDAALCAPSGANAVGMGCEKPLDCAGSATCLTDMKGGYCARVGCGLSDPCDKGSACVLRNGKFMCLKTCAADTDCAIATKQIRKCVSKSDVQKKTVQVCSDSSKSSPVGSACIADLDCDSKFCSIYAKGTCSVGGALCVNDSQCGPSGPCVIPSDGSGEKGICSALCDTTKDCPTGGLCIASPGSSSGTCQPKCMGPGDDASCGGVPGNMCLFGQPLVTPTGPQLASYGCATRPNGTAGADCSDSTDCAKGANCITNSTQTGGYCADPCDGTKACPFGNVCVDLFGGGAGLCNRMCSIDADCPGLFTCKNSTQAGTKVCQP